MTKVSKCKNCNGTIISVDGKVWTHVKQLEEVEGAWMAINSNCKEAVPIKLENNEPKNYTYVSDYVVVIVTANNQEEADEIFKHTVRNPERFRSENNDEYD